MINYDLIVIGGGPAGLAAAVAAKEAGIDQILILERNNTLGGILQQCIHNGFGLHIFKEELTGPEYAQRFINQVHDLKIKYELNTMVIDLKPNHEVIAVNETEGLQIYKAKAIILAMGCRERPRGALNIPGSRPAGIFSAGTAQKFVNLEGKMPGKEIVIVGSGDIGLIMARRMTFEGAKVKAVVELMPYSSGLKRNIVQCLKDYDIPLYLSHTVTEIHGKDRVSGVTIAKVDQNLKPMLETKQDISCDTLFFSVGLLPENELSKKAAIELGVTGGPVVDENMATHQAGIFACGNVLHVHDLVDYVTLESRQAGKAAAHYIKGLDKGDQTLTNVIPIAVHGGVRYCIPCEINDTANEAVELKFRVDNIYKQNSFQVYFDDQLVLNKKFKVAVPGEMEKLILTPALLTQLKQTQKIHITIGGMSNGNDLH